jgi:hypothetical protein
MQNDPARKFEDDVRHIASELWPDSRNGGAYIEDGLERDSIFVTEDVVHLIECTTSRTKDKAIKDGQKLFDLKRKKQREHKDKSVQCWFITQSDPTADQRTAVRDIDSTIKVLSFEEFQAKIIDVRTYYQLRKSHQFGSVRNPENDRRDTDFVIKTYIEIVLSEYNSDSNLVNVNSICQKLSESSSKILILGHYGVGKSVAMYKIYELLFERYFNKVSYVFPIYLNLREHQGQTDPTEALYRHAKKIGFKSPDHLIRAWKTGYAILILDGFDELGVFGWAGKTNRLKGLRYESMQLIRQFVRETPATTPMLICGRVNYFDSISECLEAFSLEKDFKVYRMGDFTQDQVEEYLKKLKIDYIIPEWMPTRPLLFSYLISHKVIQNLVESHDTLSFAEGWDYLLDKVCKRESEIETGVMSYQIREIIEGLATLVRKFDNGIGPIYKNDIELVFTKKCGYPPGDKALILIQRLPGLVSIDEEEGLRSFIDFTFADVARAGEVFRYIENPFGFQLTTNPAENWRQALDEKGTSLLAHKIINLNNNELVKDALANAVRNKEFVLATDIILAMITCSIHWDRNDIKISDVSIPTFEFKEDVRLYGITFNECIFQQFVLEGEPVVASAPKFVNCIIGTLWGRTSNYNLPENVFSQTTFIEAEKATTTTSSILSLDLPLSVKVGMTVLKKLYLQPGSGRQENAFYRGLSTTESAYVNDILQLFRGMNICIPSNSSQTKVWLPNRQFKNRVNQIILKGNYNDEIVSELKKL